MNFSKILFFLLSITTYENLKAGTIIVKEKKEMVTYLQAIESEGNPIITGPVNHFSMTEGKTYKITQIKCQSKKDKEQFKNKFEISLQEISQNNAKRRTLRWETNKYIDFCIAGEKLKKAFNRSHAYEFK